MTLAGRLVTGDSCGAAEVTSGSRHARGGGGGGGCRRRGHSLVSLRPGLAVRSHSPAPAQKTWRFASVSGAKEEPGPGTPVLAVRGHTKGGRRPQVPGRKETHR